MKYAYNKLQNNGFTLLEVLVALGIFFLVISVVVGTFVGSSKSQKKTIELYDTQREASYLMETVSRELRMATKLCNDTTADCATKENQENNNDSDIEFKNYDGEWITYCRFNNTTGTCDSNGDYFARDGEIINSSAVKITNLIFYVTDNFDGLAPVENRKQPIVTIVMEIESAGSYSTGFTLQNSIAMRLYK